MPSLNAPTHVPNGLGHFDIAGPKLSELAPFYAAVLGWRVEPRGPGYALLHTPDGSPNGALVEAEQPGITIGLVVPHLEQAVAQVLAHQGSVAMPIIDNGYVRKAQVRDPAGNLLTLIDGA